MLAFLVGFVFSTWDTISIGEPTTATVHGEYMLISSQGKYVSMVNATSGIPVWRSKVYQAIALAADKYVVAAAKHYYYTIDYETGLVIYQYKHKIRNIIEIATYNSTVVIRGINKLGCYIDGKTKWEIEFKDETPGLELAKNGTEIICGSKKYSLEDGSVTGEGKAAVKPKHEFRYVPTLLEYMVNGEPLWKIEEPLYGALLRTALAPNKLLLTNDTHFFVYDILIDQIVFIQEGTVYNAVDITDGCVLDTENGALIIDRKSLKVEPYTGKTFAAVIQNTTIKMKKHTFSFPSFCQMKCTKGAPGGYVLAVAECDKDLHTAVLDNEGHTKYLTHTVDSHFGTCWNYEDSFSVSYYKNNKKISYVTSFNLPNMSQRTVTTESLIVGTQKNHVVYSNGRIHDIKPEHFHGAVPFSGYGVHYMPDVVGVRIQGSYENVKAVIDVAGCFAIQNDDIHVLQGAADDTYMSIQLSVVGGSLLITFIMLYSSRQTKKVSFWK